MSASLADTRRSVPAYRAVVIPQNCRSCGSRTCTGPRAITILPDRITSNPHFVRALREFLATKRIPRRQMLDWLMGILRDHPCAAFTDSGGRIVDLNFDVLEDTTEWWWKDFCVAPAPHIRCRVKQVARQRVRVLATILSVAFPFEAAAWTQAASDNNRS